MLATPENIRKIQTLSEKADMAAVDSRFEFSELVDAELDRLYKDAVKGDASEIAEYYDGHSKLEELLKAFAFYHKDTDRLGLEVYRICTKMFENTAEHLVREEHDW